MLTTSSRTYALMRRTTNNFLDQLFDNYVDFADKQLAKLTITQDDFNKHIDTAGDQLDRHHDDVIKQLKTQHKSFRAEHTNEAG